MSNDWQEVFDVPGGVAFDLLKVNIVQKFEPRFLTDNEEKKEGVLVELGLIVKSG